MQLLEKLFQNERVMKAMFGLGSAKFGELGERLKQLHVKKLQSRKNRKRAIGGGRTGLIPTGRHKLAFILFYLKMCPTFDIQGVFSGINGPECCRWVRKLLPLLEELPGQKQLPSKRWIASAAQFAAAFPQAAEVMMDGMERPVRRSKEKACSASIAQGKRRGAHARRLSSWMGSAGQGICP